MKITIALRGNHLNDRLDEYFGRSNFFCIYDLSINSAQFIKNEFIADKEGVGKLAVDLLLGHKVEMIVASKFGRKVRTILEKKKIQMVIVQDTSLSGNDILRMIK
jgi:predicted Fe-Mo cluster-binding NifX family protein